MEGDSENYPLDDNNDNNENSIGYSVELDVSSINNLLNMYSSVNGGLYTSNGNMTTNVNGMPLPPLPFTNLSSEIQNCPAGNISQLYDDIEPLYVSDLKDIKNHVIDILNNRSEFKDEELDDDVNYENKEIDELYEKIKIINEEFKGYQENLHNAEVILNKEVDKLNSNVKKIEQFIGFLENLSSIDYEDVKDIINSINNLSTKLSNVDSFKKAKQDYIKERKNILKYIYFLRKVNKMNVTNICVVCMENQVTHFINPCGHTFCGKCLEKTLDIKDINNIETIHVDKKCPMCRKYINNVNPLYFL
jgi:hypothetical protein